MIIIIIILITVIFRVYYNILPPILQGCLCVCTCVRVGVYVYQCMCECACVYASAREVGWSLPLSFISMLRLGKGRRKGQLGAKTRVTLQMDRFS